ncbi:MAG: glutathione synthase [Thermodesulfobacteriota bacterium]|nr:glutathione synthase [Thermodesulfobacteriota bacterium]
MILSFHPNIVAEKNILCAGRLPNDEDRAAICQAQAVILFQGCTEALYKMCRHHCPHVFPNYDVRFDYPGKVGQARLFQELDAPFPQTHTFDQLSSYQDLRGHKGCQFPLGFPCVFKFDWGGEGEGVFLLKTEADLAEALKKAQQVEQGGLKGFLLQEYIPCSARSLRVVMIGDKLISYWRQQQNSAAFLSNLKSGALIDRGSDPGLQEEGKALVKDFSSKTGINLAAFDLLFSDTEQKPNPFFLEINYFFGRQGLGGSLKYYEMVDEAVARWLSNIGLSL